MGFHRLRSDAVQFRQFLYRVTRKLDTNNILESSGDDVYGIPADAESRICSSFGLMSASFSMYWSFWGR